MRPRIGLQALILAVTLVVAFSANVNAAIIPYPNVGTPNPITYSFIASGNGPIVAYFAGTGASYTESVGMYVNGVLSPNGFGLDNQTSSIGESFDMGNVTAGESIVFAIQVVNLGNAIAYSDPSLNVPYDSLDGGGNVANHNHVYSVAYDASSGLLSPSIPSGTYVAFEDLPFPNSDYNYFDETYVFTNVSAASPASVPEPASLIAWLLLGGFAIGLGWLRKRKAA
jgi:hypothetical protein